MGKHFHIFVALRHFQDIGIVSAIDNITLIGNFGAIPVRSIECEPFYTIVLLPITEKLPAIGLCILLFFTIFLPCSLAFYNDKVITILILDENIWFAT